VARRSDHTREELHQMMLDAARHVAATDGPEAITARRIAGDIGYSPGTIYQLFDNLDALIVALKSLVLSEILERLYAITMTGKVEQDVLALVDAYLAYERDEPALWRSLFDLSLPGGSPFPENFAQQIAGGLARVERALTPLGLSEADRITAARTLWAGLHGIISLARNSGLAHSGAGSAEALAHHFAVTYLKGLSTG
jgi:AcrR family transcriptional regulator